jgi:hypothetical protein
MIDMTNKDDPSFVYGPRFFKLKAKMVGNMMEWKNPINTMAHTGAAPEVKRTTRRQSSEAPANRLSSRGARTFYIMAEPVKRPIMKPAKCACR